MSFQDLAAISANIPLNEATLKSWKLELRFDHYTGKALASLKSSLLADHMRRKGEALATEELVRPKRLPRYSQKKESSSPDGLPSRVRTSIACLSGYNSSLLRLITR